MNANWDVTPWQYRVTPQVLADQGGETENAISSIANALTSGSQAYNAAKNQVYDVEAHRQAISPRKITALKGGQLQTLGEIPATGELKEVAQGSAWSFNPITGRYEQAMTTGAGGEATPLTVNKKTDIVERDTSPKDVLGLGTGILTDKQKDFYANEWAHDRMPPTNLSRLMGFGGSKAGQLADVAMRANEIIKNPSKAAEPAGLRTEPIDLATYTKEFNFANSQKTQMLKTSLDTVKSEMEKISKLNKDFERTDFPMLNNIITSMEIAGGGEDAAKWSSAVTLFQDTMNNVLKTGTPTDQTLRLAVKALNPNLGQDQFNAVLQDVIKAFIAYRQDPLNFRTADKRTYSAPSAGKIIVKTFSSPSTGKKKIVYSDGTEEIQ